MSESLLRFIFRPAFPLGSAVGAAALGGLEIPYVRGVHAFSGSRVGAGSEEGESAPPKVLICRNFGQNLKVFWQNVSKFLTILMNLCFFVIECINKSLLRHTKYRKYI